MEIPKENNLQEILESQNPESAARIIELCRMLIIHQNYLYTRAGVGNNKEVKVVELIGRKNRKCSMREISKTLSFPMSSTTLIMDRLVKKGLVRREHSEEDRRIVYGELTESGRILFEEERQKYLELSESMLNNLSDEEQMILIALLRKGYGRRKDK